MKKQIVLSMLSVGLVGIITLSVVLSMQQQKQIYRSDASSEIVGIQGGVIARLSDFPVYPNAKIEESTERKYPLGSSQDVHAVWKTTDSVKQVMAWYLAELPKAGWNVQPPDDLEAYGEQVAQIAKGDLVGYIGIEDEDGMTEIVVDFRKTQQ